MFLFGSSNTKKWEKNDRLATTAYAKGDLDTAEARWLEAVNAARSPDVVPINLAVGLMRLGSLHLIVAEYDQADEYLHEALSLCSSGACLAQSSETAVASVADQIAKRLESMEYECTQLREHAALGYERQQLADAFVRGIPNRPNALNEMAILLRHEGETKWAIALLKRAVHLAPNDPTFLGNLGNVLRQDGEITEAISVLQHSLQLRPDHPPTLNNLGYALRMHHQPGEAISILTHCLHLRPGHSTTLNNLALAYIESGDPSTALHMFEQLSGATEPHIKIYAQAVLGDLSNFDFAWGMASASLTPAILREFREDFEILSSRGVTSANEVLTRLKMELASNPISFMRPSVFQAFLRHGRITDNSIQKNSGV